MRPVSPAWGNVVAKVAPSEPLPRGERKRMNSLMNVAIAGVRDDG